MATHNVEYKVNLTGNAGEQLSSVARQAENTTSAFNKLSGIAFRFNNVIGAVGSVWNRLSGAMSACVTANEAQAEAQAKLTQVMRNTMDASDAQVRSILDLASAQQQLGVIGDEVQLAGAQELGTYLEKTSSLEKLIPVMNDMIAQQYGYNATQESAVNIATMMGKVMEGQTGALSRYGYSFTAAQEAILKYGTEAQKAATLTKVITESVGGMNAALAQTPEGKVRQLQNRFSDLQERLGGLFVRAQAAFAPIMDTIIGKMEQLTTWVERNEAVVTAAIVKVQNVLYGAWAFVQNWSPLLIGIAAGITAVTIATNASAIATTAANAATKLWAGAQAVLNAVMSANPIGLIIAGITILIGTIVAVCSHITGWATLWDAALASMRAGLDYSKLRFEGFLNGLLMGFDKLKIGWYKFKEALGIGDSAANRAMIEQINGDVERRQRAILSASVKANKSAAEAREKIAAVDMKWQSRSAKKADSVLGTNNALFSAVNNSTGSGNALATGQEAATAASAVATGGKRSTTINISIGDMIRELHFNGTTRENQQDIERTFAETLSRVLGMAGA